MPAVAVGIRDLGGTGNFGSEYLVASKSIGRSDLTVGVGWGRLSGSSSISNPLTLIDDRFQIRSADVGSGGRLSLDDFFSGQTIGLFGGIRHQLEFLPVSLLLEYNPDTYDNDFESGVPRPKAPWSAGLDWLALPGVNISLSLQHGNQIGVGVRSSLDTKVELPRRTPDYFISSYYLHAKDLPPQIRKHSWYDRLLFDVERSGLFLLEGMISPDGKHAKLVVGNDSYALWSDAIGVHTALADLHLPATVNSIHFVVEENGHRSVTMIIPRPSSTRSADSRVTLRRIKKLPGRTLEAPQHRTSFVTGQVNNTFNLRTRFQLFDPDDPARYQVYGELGSEYALSNHWAIRSAIAIDIENNFGESRRQISNSSLPKVRSNVAKYLASGTSGLEKFIVEGRDTVGSKTHFRVFGATLKQCTVALVLKCYTGQQRRA